MAILNKQPWPSDIFSKNMAIVKDNIKSINIIINRTQNFLNSGFINFFIEKMDQYKIIWMLDWEWKIIFPLFH